MAGSASPMIAARGCLCLIALSTSLAPAAALADAGRNASGFRPIVAWRSFRGTGIPETWKVSDGLITHTPGGGDLLSVEEFGDFELDFDWKISPGGNSGVMYRVTEAGGQPYETGPEYQILDNAGHSDGKVPLTSAAGCYGLYAPTRDITKPLGEWNAGRIIVEGSHVEHWLNGEKVVEYELGSDDWEKRVAASKFSVWPAYGKARTGYIDLQDHGDTVEYRSVMVRVLPAE